MAEMLERQPSEVQSMLLRTSIVDRLNGELADLLAMRLTVQGMHGRFEFVVGAGLSQQLVT